MDSLPLDWQSPISVPLQGPIDVADLRVKSLTEFFSFLLIFCVLAVYRHAIVYESIERVWDRKGFRCKSVVLSDLFGNVAIQGDALTIFQELQKRGACECIC